LKGVVVFFLPHPAGIVVGYCSVAVVGIRRFVDQIVRILTVKASPELGQVMLVLLLQQVTFPVSCIQAAIRSSCISS
jgi:hypothetical protein